MFYAPPLLSIKEKSKQRKLKKKLMEMKWIDQWKLNE